MLIIEKSLEKWTCIIVFGRPFTTKFRSSRAIKKGIDPEITPTETFYRVVKRLYRLEKATP